MWIYEEPKIKEPGWWIFIGAMVIFLIVLYINPWVHTNWNKGKCIYNETIYELKEVNGYKYTYICPECHYELTIRK